MTEKQRIFASTAAGIIIRKILEIYFGFDIFNAFSIEDRKPILTADGLVQTSISQETQTSNGIGGQSQLTVDQLDIEILPIIYDIVRCVEKDPLENAVKLRESQDCNHKIFELQKRFESAREQIRQLPGIDYNKEEQQQRLELLRNQLKLKQQLIRKFKDTEF